MFWTELRVAEYGDLYWQIPEGLKILAGSFPRDVPYAIAAGPWVDHEWLFEAFVAWCYAHGAYGVFAGIFAAAYAAFPVALYLLLRRSGASELAAGVLAALEIGALPSASAYRPQTIALYCFVLVLFALRGDRSRYALLFVVELLWANVHASALLGPLLALFAIAGNAIERADAATLRRSAFAFGTLLVATLLTPHGTTLWTYAVSTFAGAPFQPYVDEWRPLAFGDPDAWLVFVPLVAIYTAVPRPPNARARAADLLAFAVFALLALDHRRGIAFLVPAAAPLLARQLDGAFATRELAERTRRLALALARVSAGISLALALVLGIHRLTSNNALVGARAVGLAGLAQRTNVSGNAYVWRPLAAFVPFSGYGARLLIDSHADPYDARVWHDANALETLQPDYRDALARNSLREVIVPAERPLAQVLPLLPDWRAAGTNDGLAAFVHR